MIEENVVDASASDQLKADRRKVEARFAQFKQAPDKRSQSRNARQVCGQIELHDRIEEKLVYPAAEERRRTPTTR